MGELVLIKKLLFDYLKGLIVCFQIVVLCEGFTLSKENVGSFSPVHVFSQNIIFPYPENF